MTGTELSDGLIRSLEESVRGTAAGRKVAIAFSGGLDSGIVAVLCKKYADATLYTVGAEGAYDVRAAAETADALGLPWRHIVISGDILEKEIPEMIRITGTVNPITLSFEVPLYFVIKHSAEDIVLGGQGADELFAGYSKYAGLSGDEFADLVKDDMARLLNVTLAHERAVAAEFGKTVAYPYLDRRVVGTVNDMGVLTVPEGLRKPLLRDAARSLGHPELAERPKKSAQYGSGTMAVLRSMAKKRGMTVRGMVLAMADDVKRG